MFNQMTQSMSVAQIAETVQAAFPGDLIESMFKITKRYANRARLQGFVKVGVTARD